MNGRLTGGAILIGWIIFVIVAYVLALTFIVPPTQEAHAVASVLFAWAGLISAFFGFLIWRTR